jgi:O-antigen/teichoic acid export membrane protein
MRRGSILNDSAAMFGGQIVAVIFGIGQGVLMARSLSLSDMGRFQLIMSYIAIGQVCGLPGMNVAINKGAMKGHDRILYKILRISAGWALAGGVLLFLIGGTLRLGGWFGDWGVTMMLVAAFLPFHGLDKYDSMLLGKRLFLLSRALNVMSSALSLVVVGGTALMTHRFVPTLTAAFVCRAVTVSAGLWISRRQMDDSAANPEMDRELLKMGRQQTLLSFIGIIIGQLDRLIVGSISPATLAVYYIGALIPTKVKDNSKVLFTIVTNHWGGLSKRDNLDRLKQNTWRILGMGCALTVLIWIGAPFIIHRLYGDAYSGSVRIAQWLSVTLGMGFFSIFLQSVDLFQDKGTFYIKQTYIRQAGYIGLLLLLVPRYSYWGVIAAQIIGETYAFSTSLYHFRRLLKRT